MLSHSVTSAFYNPVDYQAPLSVQFSRQEYWSGLPFPPPGDLPHPGTEPMSLMSPALAGRFFTAEPPGKRVHTHTHTHTQIKPFRNLITLLYSNYFIMVNCRGKWFLC